MRNILLAAALLMASFWVQASITPPSPTPPAMAGQLDATRDEIAAGYEAWRNKDPTAASIALEKAIYSDGFTRLIRQQQFGTLVLAGTIAQDSERYDVAHALLLRASEYSEADSDLWQRRLETAYRTKDYVDSAHSVATIARRWPETLGKINYAAIYSLDRKLESDKTLVHSQQDMLQSLFDAKWSTPEGEPCNLWRDLAAMLLAEHKLHAASVVAARIDSAEVALTMRIDKRYDRLVRKDPRAFDIDRVAADEIALYKARVKAAPDQLVLLSALEGLLLDSRQFEQVLAVSDAVVAKAEAGQGAASYKDFNEKYIWILDQRARALVRLGRWDEAIEQWARATRRPEYGEMNTSQTVNLAEFYAEIGKARQAREMVAELDDPSSVGSMQIMMVRLLAALQQDDKAAVAKLLASMRAHRADDIATWENALLATNDLEAAGDLLVERLQNKRWRSVALTDMQDYAEVRMTPIEARRLRRWHTVLAQPKVRKALARVGRIEHFNLEAPQK